MTEDGLAGACVPPSRFEATLLAANGIPAARFAGWDFAPGMRLGESEAWWRPGGRRAAPHEGLDLCRWRDGGGRRHALGAGARVPAPWACEVAALREDFLGVSVFLVAGVPDGPGRLLHAVLGHLVPRPGLGPGTRLGAGEIVGTLADPAARGPALPPHLHVTLALLPGDLPREGLGWELLRPGEGVTLLDPAGLLAQFAPRG